MQTLMPTHTSFTVSVNPTPMPHPRKARFNWLCNAPPEVIDLFFGWEGFEGRYVFFLNRAKSVEGFISGVAICQNGDYVGRLHEPLETFANKRRKQGHKRVSWGRLSNRIHTVVQMAIDGFYEKE